MKFSHAAAFEKHLSADPAHLSQIYGVVLPDSYERRLFFNQIIEKKGPAQPQVKRLSAEEVDFSEIETELCSGYLFSESSILIIDHLGSLKKETLEKLQAGLKDLDPHKTVILGAESPLPLFQALKKEMVVLDLSDEKPWDRKGRLLFTLKRWSARDGKSLTSECFDFIINNIGLDLERLENEWKKIDCFLGEKKQARLEDIRPVVSKDESADSWKIAKEIVWEESHGSNLAQLQALFKDVGSAISFLGQVRYQMEMGLKLSVIEAGDLSAFASYFPKFPLHKLEKLSEIARRRGPSYFQKGLKVLLEWECALKQRSVKEESLSAYHYYQLVGLNGG